MVYSDLISGVVPYAGKASSRGGTPIQGMIYHHAATTNVDVVKRMFASTSYEVSANYIIGNDGSIWGAVPEELRAWTSGSGSDGGAGARWDTRSITFECVDETGAPTWLISAAAQEAIARLTADCSLRYGFPIARGREGTIFGHRELWQYFGASFPTACPGGMPIDAIADRANQIKIGGAEPSPKLIELESDEMNIYLEATGNSSPIKEADGVERSRIWAGERQIGGMTFSSVWERSSDGTVRRLFKGEWDAIVEAYKAADRKVPVAKVGGNTVEQLVFGKRA